MPTDLLDRWLTALLATPGLTALRDPDEARRVLLDDALRGMPLVEREDGPIVDVGSGGGTPGIPLAASLASRTSGRHHSTAVGGCASAFATATP